MLRRPCFLRGLARYDPAVHYLLDGYNIGHWLAEVRDLHPTELRQLVITALQENPPANVQSVRIFWDVRSGIPPSDHDLPEGRMLFVPDADQAIIDTVYNADTPAKITVVSWDREVVGKSRQLGAQTQNPEEFLPNS